MQRDDDIGQEVERPTEDANTTMWRGLLTGVDPRLLQIRRFWRHVPAAPRCKVCASPFHGIGGAIARLVWHGPIPNNPLLCKACFGSLSQRVGGAEVEISVMFADIRGSTGLAERIGAGAFRRLVQDYYRVTSSAIEANGGIVDKFLGDGVMALFVPVIAGERHAARAIAAGRQVLRSVHEGGLGRKGILVGAGIHSGEAFVGVVGSGEKVDFTALGDTVNVAARLGQLAGPGELLVSRDAWDRADIGSPPASRDVVIAGREGQLPVVSVEEASVQAT
jgi:adenylate cyclase